MLKTINIVAWATAVAVILLAVAHMGASEDSRTKVIHINADSGRLAGDRGTDDTESQATTGAGAAILPQTGADDQDREGARPDMGPAVMLNDSGAVALSQGRAQEAISYLNRALAIDSTYARACYNLGIGYQSLNRLDDAVLSYSRAMKLRPSYFEPAYNLGCLYIDIEKYDEGIRWLKRATDIVRGDRSAPAHLNLGNAYRKTGQVDKAEASYREALRYRPGFVEPRFNLGLLLKSQGRYAEAVAEFEKVEALGYRPAKLYRNLGICYSNLDSLSKGAAAYEKWAALDASDGGAWYNLATMRTRLGDTVGAIAAYEGALAADSSYHQAAFNLALLFSERGLIDSARSYYELATLINPSYSRAFYNLALTYSKEARYDSAAYYYSRVIELDPENTRARFNLGLAWSKDGKTKLAADAYRAIVDMDPTNSRALNNMGTSFLDLKEYDSANWCFNRLVKLTGEPAAYFNRAKSYVRLDSLERARDDYRKAIQLRPHYGAARHNLAILEEKAGDLRQAADLLEQALDDGDRSWKRYWKLGQVYVELGEKDKARWAYVTAAKSNPESDKFQREYDSILANP